MAYRTGEQDYILWKMASLSQQASARLSNEIFRAHVENDEDTPDAIVSDVQEIFLADMREIGVSLACPVEDIAAEQDTNLWLLDLLEWVLPTTLYLIMREDYDVVRALGSLTDGSVTNGDILPAWLDWVSGYKPDLEPAIEYYRDRLVSSDLYSNCLESLVANIAQEKPQHDLPDVAYIRTVSAFFHDVDNKLSYLKDHLEEIPNRKLIFTFVSGIINTFENLCVESGFCNKFGWWLSTDRSKELLATREFYDRVESEILSLCPMVPNYYSVRNQDITNQVMEEACIITSCLFIKASGGTNYTRYSDHFKHSQQTLKSVADLLKKV